MSRPEVIEPMHRMWERCDAMYDQMKREPAEPYWGNAVIAAIRQVQEFMRGSDVRVPVSGCGMSDKTLVDDWSEM